MYWQKKQTLGALFFPDVYGVFLVTDFSSHIECKEVQQGTRAIDSAIRNGVSFFIFSGLENAKAVTGKDVFHFDYKHEIEEYGFAHKDKIKFCSVRMPFYFENFNNFHKAGEQTYVVGLPMGKSRMYAIR
jgi:hypothetical protein